MSVEFQNNVARRPSSKQSNVCHPSKVDVKTKVASKVYLVGGASGRNVRVFYAALANFGESWREAMSLYRRKVDGKRQAAVW